MLVILVLRDVISNSWPRPSRSSGSNPGQILPPEGAVVHKKEDQLNISRIRRTWNRMSSSGRAVSGVSESDFEWASACNATVRYSHELKASL